jgi:hypothetical protein
VIDLGFTIVNCCYPMSVPDNNDAGLAAVYQASADSSLVKFTPAEKALLFRALFETIPEYRAKIRIFSPRASLLALMRQHAPESSDLAAPCRGGIDYFFVDSRDGNAYPCGYRGDESLGKFWDIDRAKVDRKAVCRKCDWECWRDPSELLGPLLGFTNEPGAWLRRLWNDPAYFRIWRDDLLYMRACDYFDATRPPDLDRLARHGVVAGAARRDGEARDLARLGVARRA